MANPLDAFKGLKTWQQAAVIGGGGLAVIGAVMYSRKAKAKGAAAPGAMAAAPSATAATVSDMVTDPTTGQTYPANSVDPASGLTYATEIQEYGSVAAADEQATQAGDAAIQEGLTQTEYAQETGQYGGTAAAAAPVTTNAQWMAEVETGLSEQGYSASSIGEALAAYFAGKPLGISSDGTSEYTIINLAVSEYNPPPVGSYPILNGNGAGTLPGTGNAVVPDVVGRKDLATAEGIITQAGLVPHPAGDNAAGNKGSVTSQSPAAGSTVSKGSAVTLTYTVPGGNTAKVKVPNVTGQSAGSAHNALAAAGLVPVAPKGQTPNMKVSHTTPAAGTEVARGTHVTIATSGYVK